MATWNTNRCATYSALSRSRGTIASGEPARTLVSTGQPQHRDHSKTSANGSQCISVVAACACSAAC